MKVFVGNTMKARKKILVVNPITLFPTVMMSQRRTLNQIYSLVKNHDVDVVTFVKNDKLRLLSEKSFSGKINKFISLKSINSDERWVTKNYYNLKFQVLSKLLGRRVAVSNLSSKYCKNSITSVINRNKYDIVISHYWYGSFFFLEKFDYQPIKIIDLHGMVEEDMMLNLNSSFYRKNHNLEKKINKNSLEFQRKIYGHIDMVIPNSKTQVEIIKKDYPNLDYYYCPNGQDMSQFVTYRKNYYNKKILLFYGTLNSMQNRRAFDLFYKNVWPKILKEESETKLLIVGNKPPEDIKLLAKNSNITVTGYVEDIREYITKACCMVLPMDIGIGFRGRVVEVMSLGVPIVGNHNALDCIGFENEVNGFVTDDFNEMSKYTLRLIQDDEYRKQISKNSIKFVDENYSMSSTFDKFSKYLDLL